MLPSASMIKCTLKITDLTSANARMEMHGPRNSNPSSTRVIMDQLMSKSVMTLMNALMLTPVQLMQSVTILTVLMTLQMTTPQ